MSECAEGSVATWVSIIDPDPRTRDALRVLLARLGTEIRTYETAEGFLDAVPGGLPACLISEVILPAMSGLTLLRHLRAVSMSVPTILLATDPDVAVAVEAIREGAIDFVEKPYLDARIAQRVWAILSARAQTPA